MKVEFKPTERIKPGNDEFPDEPVFLIGVYVDDVWSGNVNFVDLVAKRVCRVSHPNMGWHTYSKREAVDACADLQGKYERGEIK